MAYLIYQVRALKKAGFEDLFYFFECTAPNFDLDDCHIALFNVGGRNFSKISVEWNAA